MVVAWFGGAGGASTRGLPLVLEGWLEVDEVALALPAVSRPSVESAAAWVRMPTVLREAAEAVARFSQSWRTGSGLRDDDLRVLMGHAAREVDRLAAWAVVDLGLPVDRAAVLAEADA